MIGDTTERASVGGGAEGVVIPRTERRATRSREGGRDYTIFIAKPAAPAPPAGYPVVYLLDANAMFGTLVDTLRVQSARSDKTGVVPALVVGIGYPTEAPFHPARHYDFTLTASVAELPYRYANGEYPPQGGAEPFLSFIEDELKPEIERDFPVDTERQTIIGHSLGGLFVLHALFTRPRSFRTYVAGSPSIHWNRRILLEEERQFVSLLEQWPVRANLLITAGELEQTHKSGMNDNARAMVDRLAGLEDKGLAVAFTEFADEGHISVLPALLSRAVRFALRTT